MGRVVEVNGAGIAVGQLVLLPAGVGTWVTEIVADIRHLIPMPEGDLDQLCMLMVNPATAQLLLTEFVDLKAGDWMINLLQTLLLVFTLFNWPKRAAQMW